MSHQALRSARVFVFGSKISDLSVKTEEYERALVHFRGGGVWGPHPDAVFQPIAEVFIDLHTRVWGRTWRRKTVGQIRLEFLGTRESS